MYANSQGVQHMDVQPFIYLCFPYYTYLHIYISTYLHIYIYANLQGVQDMEVQLFMESLLKCSDFADAVKPFHVHAQWAVRMTDEFFLQGDMERASGMRVSFMCDRRRARLVYV